MYCSSLSQCQLAGDQGDDTLKQLNRWYLQATCQCFSVHYMQQFATYSAPTYVSTNHVYNPFHLRLHATFHQMCPACQHVCHVYELCNTAESNEPNPDLRMCPYR